MSLYNNIRRPFAPGDLVMHYDTGHIGFILEVEDDQGVSVFMLNKVRSIFKTSLSRITDRTTDGL